MSWNTEQQKKYVTVQIFEPALYVHVWLYVCVSAVWGISLSVCPPVISLVSGPVVHSLRPLAY